ncbi:MAG: response regulator transcription factor [Peptococcaceae bacterium]|nr:response regulator transcription factor [Peptococcaceae bacterium]
MKERLKILVVDDEARMRKLIRDYLSARNYQVVEAENGRRALDLFFQENDFDLVILDVMMPQMDGWEVCKEIRAYSQTPIVMLTALGEERDELLGFSLGVDEYVSKPFSPKVLMARVEALIRRTQGKVMEKKQIGGLALDMASYELRVDGQLVEMSHKEFELLNFLMEYQGQALSREKILSQVWNYDYMGDSRTIDTHIKKIRQKIGDKGQYIQTVRGIGYKFGVHCNDEKIH